MTKPVILTGLRANNDMHLGNYLGALLPMADMVAKHADSYQINIMLADLHSFITPINHAELQSQIMQNLRLYVAAGLSLDVTSVHIYRQSYIPAHSELAWILSCFTSFGEMSRMTQFKDKASRLKEDRINLGLFNYPPLMAADILLYGASYVPVGEDQTQHLEYTRDVAERMNKQFHMELFKVPLPVAKQHEFFGKDQGLRIKDLADPTKKMSKSDESGKGVIFLTDTPEAATQKIMSATTDSFGDVQFDYKARPGISNLLDILKLLGGDPAEFIGQTQYGPLKETVAQKVSNFLRDFGHNLSSVDEKALASKLEVSERNMREQAEARLLKVQRAVGLRP